MQQYFHYQQVYSAGFLCRNDAVITIFPGSSIMKIFEFDPKHWAGCFKIDGCFVNAIFVIIFKR